MKILVTGGAGFVGSNFVHRTLATRPWVKIIVLDALTYSGRMANLHGVLESIEFVRGDVRDRLLLEELVPRVDAVVHFAAESHNDNSLKNPSIFLESNILGTYSLIDSCLRHDVRFHQISTDEVYGDLSLEDKIRFTSDSAYNPSSPYSASKAAADMLVRAWVRSFELRATISNCSNNYGPRQHEEKFIPRTILLAASGIKPKIYGTGKNVRDWIHVDDHSDGVWAILDRGQIGRTYLLGANQERSNLQVLKYILDHLGLKEDFFECVADRPGHDMRYALDASKTNKELGWEPQHRNFEDGLGGIIDHYLERLDSGEVDLSKISNNGASLGL